MIADHKIQKGKNQGADRQKNNDSYENKNFLNIWYI